jgi:pimeloyl-ACP methyl ester carboxylesterase
MTIKSATRWLVPLLLCWAGLAQGEVIQKTVEEGVTATAEYRAGDPSKPAMLVLHGFLQTRDFSTVRRLADALYDWNYTVLAPTLSLGIDTRARSLPCEAIQTHTMEDAVEEVRMWVEWLAAQGHDRIILVGHSSGSATHVAYLADNPHTAVKEAILISLVAFGPGKLSYETEAHAEAARSVLEDGNDALGEYALAFCRTYPTTAQNFLSYYDWSRPRVAEALSKLHVPAHILVGSNDQRMTAEWVDAMRAAHGDVIVIEGANHFFDDAHEFDLLDEFERLLGS